jgi:hypothetical protein
MKKIALLCMIALVTSIFNDAKAQKSGILQKDYYDAFSGDQWEDFMAGRNAADFEKKSNVNLSDFLTIMVLPFVKEVLNESTIASAVANSTVVDFPAGSDVYTSDTKMNWFTRKAYPGERGYRHTATGICWLSFSCGNLCKTFLNKPVTTGAQTVAYTPPANTGTGTTAGNTNNNYNVGGSGSQTNDQLLLGMKIRENDMLVDALIFKDIQKSTPSASTVVSANCNPCSSYGYTSSANIYANPSGGSIAAQPGVGTNMYASNSGTLNINETIKYKRDFLDYVQGFRNLAAGARDVKETIWGVDVNINNRLNYGSNTVGYYNNTTPLFQPPNGIGSTVANRVSGDNTLTVRTNAIE